MVFYAVNDRVPNEFHFDKHDVVKRSGYCIFLMAEDITKYKHSFMCMYSIAIRIIHAGHQIELYY